MAPQDAAPLTIMLYRRSRTLNAATDDVAGVPLSPLIDCVFLLLIFFLVTSMLKRRETMLPVALPDSTSALAETADEDVLVIGLDETGAFLEPAGRDPYGALSYRPGGSLDAYLETLPDIHGPSVHQTPLRFDVARETPFQKTIDALDLCALRGFVNVSVRIRDPMESPR